MIARNTTVSVFVAPTSTPSRSLLLLTDVRPFRHRSDRTKLGRQHLHAPMQFRIPGRADAAGYTLAMLHNTYLLTYMFNVLQLV